MAKRNKVALAGLVLLGTGVIIARARAVSSSYERFIKDEPPFLLNGKTHEEIRAERRAAAEALERTRKRRKLHVRIRLAVRKLTRRA